MSGASLLFEVAVVLLLILLNAFFAMSELAIVSSRRARLKPLADRGHRGAKRALRLAENPTQFLATAQIGITLVGIVAGAYSGATLSAPVAALIQDWPLVGDYAFPLAVTLVVAAITYLSLVVGELVPKRIAMSHAEAIAVRVALPMMILAKIGTPIVFALRVSTEGLLRLLGVHQGTRAKITEDEVRVMIAEGAETGVFMPQERHMIEGVLHLADHSVRTIMTPRPDIEWLDVQEDASALMQAIVAAEHSRLLLCERTIDEVLGFVHVKDLLMQVAADKPLDPRAVQPGNRARRIWRRAGHRDPARHLRRHRRRVRRGRRRRTRHHAAAGRLLAGGRQAARRRPRARHRCPRACERGLRHRGRAAAAAYGPPAADRRDAGKRRLPLRSGGHGRPPH
jgi:putative hemolysin